MARLVLKGAEFGNRVIELNLGLNRLGCGPENDFPIEHPTVSATHCELVVADDGVVVRDCASTNGTFVNSRPIKEARLTVGQTLRLGDVELLVESTEVTIAIPKFEVAQGAPLLVLSGSPLVCSCHPETHATHRCTACQKPLCWACVRRLRRRGGRIVTLCPHCGQPCELLCSRHYGSRATHVCTGCHRVFCDACVRKVRRRGGKVLKLCGVCSQECVLICPRHPEARAMYRCTHCRVAICDACARRTRRRGGGTLRTCPFCRHAAELICPRHPESRATYQCTHCQEYWCRACVQHLRGKSGEVMRFCSRCGNPCDAIEGRKAEEASLFDRLQDSVKRPFSGRSKAKRGA